MIAFVDADVALVVLDAAAVAVGLWSMIRLQQL